MLLNTRQIRKEILFPIATSSDIPCRPMYVDYNYKVFQKIKNYLDDGDFAWSISKECYDNPLVCSPFYKWASAALNVAVVALILFDWIFM